MKTSARLIAKTVPVEGLIPEMAGTLTADEFIPFVARVSNPGNQANLHTGPKLVNYLIEKHHWSPLDMADAVIEVKTTRDIGRQMLRHWSARFQEHSQRYAEVPDFHEPKIPRRQDPENRQNSINDLSAETVHWWLEYQAHIVDRVSIKYKEALDKGIAKECARVILPEGLTMTTMYVKMSIRSWYHYMNERLSLAAQLEHRIVAKACYEELAQHFPTVFSAMEDD